MPHWINRKNVAIPEATHETPAPSYALKCKHFESIIGEIASEIAIISAMQTTNRAIILTSELCILHTPNV